MSSSEEQEQLTATSFAASLLPTASLFGSGTVGIGAVPIFYNGSNRSHEISDNNPAEDQDRSNKFSF